MTGVTVRHSARTTLLLARHLLALVFVRIPTTRPRR
jgi:hypothetical protein